MSSGDPLLQTSKRGDLLVEHGTLKKVILKTMRAHVILYTKPGCHLCDEMKKQIAAAECDDLFVLEEVNIETDPELAARFRFDIPVLFINERRAFQHRLTPDAFKTAVHAVLRSL